MANAIAPDRYAVRRGKLSPAQERAILAFGDLGTPLYVNGIKSVMRMETMWALERKGYAFFSHYGRYAQTWALTDSGCKQYRRLKGITA